MAGVGPAVRGHGRGRTHLDDAGRAVGVYGHDRGGAPVDLAARFVVGADGLGSRVARAVGAEIIENRGDRGAVQYAYFAACPGRGSS